MSQPHRFVVPWDEQQGFKPQGADRDVPCEECGKTYREHQSQPTARELIEGVKRGDRYSDEAGLDLAERVEKMMDKKWWSVMCITPDNCTTKNERAAWRAAVASCRAKAQRLLNGADE